VHTPYCTWLSHAVQHVVQISARTFPQLDALARPIFLSLFPSDLDSHHGRTKAAIRSFSSTSHFELLAPYLNKGNGSAAFLSHPQAPSSLHLQSCDVVLMLEDRPSLNPRLLQTLRLLQSAKATLAPFLESLHTSVKTPQTGQLTSLGGQFPTCPVLLFVFQEDASEEEPGSANQPQVSRNRASPSRTGRLPGSDRDEPGTNRRPPATSSPVLKRKLAATLEAQVRLVLRKSRLTGGYKEGQIRGGARRGDGDSKSGGEEPLFRIDASRVSVFITRQGVSPAAGLETVTASLRDSTHRWIDSMKENAALGGEFSHLKGESKLGPPASSPWEESVNTLLEAIWAVSGAPLLANNGSGRLRSVEEWKATWEALSASFSQPNPEQGFAQAVSLADGTREATSGSGTGVRDEVFAFSDLQRPRYLPKSGAPNETETPKTPTPTPTPTQTRTQTQTQTKTPDLPARASLQAALLQLQRASDPLYAYSSRLCEAALPAALEEYLRDLPEHYPVMEHQRHVAMAVWLLREKGGGPALEEWVKLLEGRCEETWKQGRKSCEAKSLTGRPCIYSVSLSLPFLFFFT
jgi:hypothetical protein